jgi:hypothetical protein
LDVLGLASVRYSCDVGSGPEMEVLGLRCKSPPVCLMGCSIFGALEYNKINAKLSHKAK